MRGSRSEGEHEGHDALAGADALDARIVRVRGQRVILDADIAHLYGVETRELVQAVKRNAARFPSDFMFQLDADELEALRSRNVISNGGRGGRRTLPYAFTEQGVAMLSGVIRSNRAVQVNIEIMRAFVRLRRLLDANAELAEKVDALESRYGEQFRVVFVALRELMSPPARPARRIGFGTSDEDSES
jgi:hypothetical protein